MNKKTCIIAEGGGLRGSYAVGVVKALAEKFHITSVDLAIGTSSSSATLAYYVARQFDSITNIWSTLLTTWRLVSLRNVMLGNPLLNIDYLVDVVFKQQDRLNIDRLKSNTTEFLVPVTNYHTGEAQYFSNQDKTDFFEVLRAAMAIQFFYGKSVEISGQRYVDGALSVPLGFTKALEAGATDIIVISTRPVGFKRSHSVSERLMTQLFTRGWPEGLKQRLESYPETYNSIMETIREEVDKKERNIVLIQPTSAVITGRLGNSSKKLLASIDQGYADACQHTELRSLGRE